MGEQFSQMDENLLIFAATILGMPYEKVLEILEEKGEQYLCRLINPTPKEELHDRFCSPEGYERNQQDNSEPEFWDRESNSET